MKKRTFSILLILIMLAGTISGPAVFVRADDTAIQFQPLPSFETTVSHNSAMGQTQNVVPAVAAGAYKTAVTLTNPTGVFFRLDVTSAAAATGTERMTVCFESSKGLSGHRSGVFTYIWDNGTVETITNNRVPKNFKGFIIINTFGAGNNGTLLDIDLMTGIALYPDNYAYGGSTWQGAVMTAGKAGFIKFEGTPSNTQYLAAALQFAEAYLTGSEFDLQAEGISEKLFETANPIDKSLFISAGSIHDTSFTSGDANALFFYLKAEGMDASAYNYQLVLNSYGSGFPICNQAARRVYVSSIDGSISHGNLPQNFEGFVFIWTDYLQELVTLSHPPVWLGIYPNNWGGGSSWAGVTITAGWGGVTRIMDSYDVTALQSLVGGINDEIEYRLANAPQPEFQVLTTENEKTAYSSANPNVMNRIVPEAPASEFEHTTGVFFYMKAEGMTDGEIPGYQMVYVKDYGTSPYVGNNRSNRIYITLDGAVTSGGIPPNFEGYVFVLADAGELDMTRVEQIALLPHNWENTSYSWAGISLTLGRVGYLSLPSAMTNAEYADMSFKIHEQIERLISQKPPITHSFEVINDYETADKRKNGYPSTSPSGGAGGGITGKQALSGDGSLFFQARNDANALLFINASTAIPRIDNPSGIFFRLKTDAKKGANFQLSCGEFAGDYIIGSGSATRKVFVSKDGTVSRHMLPTDNFDGYVFVPAPATDNYLLNASRLYTVGIWYHTGWDSGVPWRGSIVEVDNMGYYNVSEYAGDTQYQELFRDITAVHRENSPSNTYFTLETDPRPLDTLTGISGMNVLLKFNEWFAAETEANWEILSGSASIKPEGKDVFGADSAMISYSKGGNVVLRAASKADPSKSASLNISVYADITELEDLYYEALELDNDDGQYTAASWKALQDAIMATENLMDKEFITQDECDNAYKILSAAINGLKKNSVSVSDNSGGGNQNKTENDITDDRIPDEPDTPAESVGGFTLEKLLESIGESTDSTVSLRFSEHVVFIPEMLQALKDANKGLKITMVDNSGDFVSMWVFETITDASASFCACIKEKSFYAPAVYRVIGDAKAIIVPFEHSGPLPGKAEITVKNPSVFKSDDRINLYYINPQTGLEYQHPDVIVSGDGSYVRFGLTHCSDYVMSVYADADALKAAGITEVSSVPWIIIVVCVTSGVIVAAGTVFLILFFKNKRRNYRENV